MKILRRHHAKKIDFSWVLLIAGVFLVHFLTKIIVDRKTNNHIFEVLIFKINLTTIANAIIFIVTIYILVYKRILPKYLIVLLATFLISNLLNIHNWDTIEFVEKSRSFMALIFIFMLTPVLKLSSIKTMCILYHTILFIGIANLILCLWGILSDIEILRTYPYSGRFGWNGLFFSGSNSTVFYIVMIFGTYFFYMDDVSRRQTNSILLIIFIFSGLLTGTKAVLFSILFLMTFHVFFYIKNKAIKLMFFTVVCLAIIFNKFILYKFASFYPFGPAFIDEGNIISFLSSKRDVNLDEAMVFIKQSWMPWDYFLGNYNFLSNPKAVEISFIDIYLFFGVIGIVTYTLFFKNQFFNKGFGWRFLILLFVFMSIIFLSGGFFPSIFNISIFCIVIIYCLKEVERRQTTMKTIFN